MGRSRAMLNKQQRRQKQQQFFEQFKSKPFWIWNNKSHKEQYHISSGRCCFNHVIGLPVKNSKKMPLFDYEQEIYDVLQETKYVWIKKATGLGITEFMLRYMAWLCLRDDKLKGSHMCVVTGYRIEMAIKLIDRIKGLFPMITFYTRKEQVELNGVKIKAFPSYYLDAMRGLANVSFILLDEADFLPPGQQQNARYVSEGYIAKSNPYIVLVSTPNAAGGLFEQIEKETEDKCLYKRLFLDYTCGLNRIYTPEEIEKARASPSFDRAYDLKYVRKIRNVFHKKGVEELMMATDAKARESEREGMQE